MLRKLFILVVIISFCVCRLDCQKATVPFEVCEEYYHIPLTYKFNTTVDASVFKTPDYFLSKIQEHPRYSLACKDFALKVVVTRTLNNKGDMIGNYEITAEYTVTVGIKDAYHYNHSVLDDGIEDKIYDCSEEIYENILAPRFFDYSIPVNISGRLVFPGIVQTSRRKSGACKDPYFRCPPAESLKVDEICECSQGWYLKNVSSIRCTKCPKDTYQETTGMFNCTRCSQGYTTLNETGRTNRTDCKLKDTPTKATTTTSLPENCSKGEYFNTTSNTCLPCAINTYKDVTGNTPCKSCPQGLITSKEGADNPTSCIESEETGRNDGVVTIVVSICIMLAVVIGAVVFLLFRIKMKREKARKARDIEEFRRNFVRQHETTNDYYRPESSDDEQAENEEGTGNDEVPTLGDLAEDVARRNLEIPRDFITITRVRLGRGQFGEVKQAFIRRPDQPEILCAAKMARGSHVPLEDMLDELEIHLKLEDKHENVVNLIGVCSSGGPFYLIMEYCENGSLVDYLRKHDSSPEYVNIMSDRETLSLEWKQSRTLEICDGMKHLAKHRIVHRDLAARNVLLDMNTVAKISDFGMAKDVYMKSYYTQKHEGCFPLRWMAMESLRTYTFNEKTDVWSFGVLVWEIFTNGDLPYYDIFNDEKVADKILKGKKLKQPENCPKFLYSLMLRCWNDKSYNRPNFAELYHSLSEHIQKQPKRGLRKFSRDIIKQFEVSGSSLKRKFSRKGSRKSVDSVEPHTSFRRSSRDELDGRSNDMELKRHEPPDTMLGLNTASRTEDENQHVETLNKIEEDKMEQYTDNEDCLRNSRSSIGVTPQRSINPNVNSPTEDMPSISSKPEIVQNNNEDMGGKNDAEMNLNLTKNFETPNTDRGSEKINSFEHQDVDGDSSTTDSMEDSMRKGSSGILNTIDDVLGSDQQRRECTNTSHLKDLSKSEKQNDLQDFSVSSNATEENTLSKTEEGSSQASEDNSIDIEERPKLELSYDRETSEEPIPAIPEDEHCMTTDLDDLSDESSKGDQTDGQLETTDESLPQSNLDNNEERSPDKVESEGDVLNAVNVSKNKGTVFSPTRNETGEQDTPNTSSC